jgi:hypothetical protein
MHEPTIDRRLLALAIIPVSIYILTYAVIDNARPTGIVFATVSIAPPLEIKVAAVEAKLRYFWLSALVLLTAVSLAVGASSLLSVWRDSPKRDRKLVLGLVVLASVLVMMVERSSLTEHWYAHMGHGLFRSVFGRMPEGGMSALEVLDLGLDVSKGATAIALVALVACFLMTLTRPPQGASEQAVADHFKKAFARQRTYLQHAALLYVFAVMAVISWMYWPLPFFADAANLSSYRELLVGAAVLHGVTFSLGVAAIYLPPAMLLRSRALEYAVDLPVDGQAAEQLRSTFATNPMDQLRQVAVMIAPALVSILPALKDIFQVTATAAG